MILVNDVLIVGFSENTCEHLNSTKFRKQRMEGDILVH